MQMLYESEQFVVVWEAFDDDTREGYELVDKTTSEQVFLHGAIAKAFAEQIKVWRADPPEAEKVEAKLIGLMRLGRFPLILH